MPFSQSGGSTGSGSAGFEIGYDQITSPVSVTATTEAAGTTVISCAAHTFDGSAVFVTFFAASVSGGGACNVSLFEASTQITELADSNPGASGNPITGMFRFTPTAGSHTYTVTAFRTVSNATIQAGSGGTAGFPPCFIRFTKV